MRAGRAWLFAAAAVVALAPGAAAATRGGVPVSVMLPLNIVDSDSRSIKDEARVAAEFAALRRAGARGVMVDVWWGLVEREKPRDYHFAPYVRLAELARDANLTLQCVMSFHQCGGNVGDTCFIPLPPWVRQQDAASGGGSSGGGGSSDFFYTDQHGATNDEYVSLWADDEPVLADGRTPLAAYADFMRAFRGALGQFMPATLNEVQVGLGPAGELRYPSYPLSRWHYCGVGAFQSYDRYALASLRAAAAAAGHPEWAHAGGPANAGSYNSAPHDDDARFFRDDGGHDNFASPYGRFYLDWYAGSLERHGARVLAAANATFAPVRVKVAAKVAGIHWWYGTASHAAELTAGYYNTNGVDAYARLAERVFAPTHAVFDFTCLEMRDNDAPGGDGCASRPASLVAQTQLAAMGRHGLLYAGENALPMCGDHGCDGADLAQCVRSAAPPNLGRITQFTMLRLDDALLREPNIGQFADFCAKMAALQGRRE